MSKRIQIETGRLIHIKSFRYSRKELPVELQGKENKAVCTITYPFHKCKTIEFTFTSINDIVKAVRNGLMEMYNCSEQQEQPPMLINQIFEGKYGAAYHSIGDLFIEGIYYNVDTCKLDVNIGS